MITWEEFDIEVAEEIHQKALRQVAKHGLSLHAARPAAAQIKELETVMDWYYRFQDLDLTLLDDDDEDEDDI